MIDADIRVPGLEILAYFQVYPAASNSPAEPGVLADGNITKQRRRQTVGRICLHTTRENPLARRPAVSGH